MRVLEKITTEIRNVKYGLQNYWIWKRIIYIDRDWDWAFLYRIMAFKMDRMADSIEQYGCTENKHVTVEELRECAKRLRRVEEEDYHTIKEQPWHEVLRLLEQDEEWIYSCMKNKARTWWD